MTTIVNRGSYPLSAEDEGRHPVGDGTLWNESYYLDFASADGELGGYVRLGLYPNWQRAWYWACVVRPGQPAVIVADNHVPPPAAGGLAVEADGLRAHVEVTEPLAAARVVLDSPALGLDLAWRTAGGVYGYALIPRYEIPCEVSGAIRLEGREIAFSGHGERDHSWGERDWWSLSWVWLSGRFDDGTFIHATRVNLGLDLPWPCFVAAPGRPPEHRDGLTATSTFDGDGQPAAAYLRWPGGPDITVTPLAFATVTMTSPDGIPARFPRALCRFEADDGRRGTGWAEWHQPPGWRDHEWRGFDAP